MTREELEDAISEAIRFVRAARSAIEEMEKDERDYVLVGTRKSGAARRASLDLTRALADLRNNARRAR